MKHQDKGEESVPVGRIMGPTGSLGGVLMETKTSLVVEDNGLPICKMSFKDIYYLISPKIYDKLPQYVKEYTLINERLDYKQAIESVVKKL